MVKNRSIAASFGLSLIVGMVLLLLVAQRTQLARDINDDSDRPMLLQEIPYLSRLESAPTQSLYQAPWLQDIFGKDTTYDFDYIKSLKSGPVEDAGYEGLPKIKGVLPTDKDLASADALLKRAIDTDTMPADIGTVWDGKPYVPDDKLKEEISNAWSGFHMAMGEKKWEKLVSKDCAGKKPSECEAVMSGQHEGYKTAWDGEEWKQFDGQDWKTLEFPQD
eukprot:CAMPEP_0172180830 /NCGR_PEP_ID=MMETSP1050-20130122/17471_1 /TAXON_ID=233186 /ORGANISM="Cryptomonas curvata, Strain CCAP979/52" /LENGTH=219 /DNA_ID=CAMNT_0012854027 /DNA_START=11 /DNA_END=670 /DNA_ORIENTATION=+